MPGNYSQGVVDEVLRIASEQGKLYGAALKEAVEKGDYAVGQRVNLLVPLGEIKTERFSLLTRATLAAGSPAAGVACNSVIVGLGVYTGGSSALQFGISTDPKAKALYATSVAFSASAIISGSFAVASRTCHISGTAAISEAWGFALMKLGNKAHVTALQLEGKPIPPKLQHLVDPSIRPPGYNTNGMGFIMPNAVLSSNIIAAIPFEHIGRAIGFGLAVYSYSKVVILAYRYGQQFLSKYRSDRTDRAFRLFSEQRPFLMLQLKFRMQLILYRIRRKPQKNLLFSAG